MLPHVSRRGPGSMPHCPVGSPLPPPLRGCPRYLRPRVVDMLLGSEDLRRDPTGSGGGLPVDRTRRLVMPQWSWILLVFPSVWGARRGGRRHPRVAPGQSGKCFTDASDRDRHRGSRVGDNKLLHARRFHARPRYTLSLSGQPLWSRCTKTNDPTLAQAGRATTPRSAVV